MHATPAGRETGGAPGSPPPRGRSVLVRYLAAAALARLADDGARVALVLLALDRTGSATFGGWLVAALLVPHVVAAPIVGALADRVARRRAFHVGALVAFGSTLALCALLVGQAPAAAVLAVAVLGGCVGPLLTGGSDEPGARPCPQGGVGARLRAGRGLVHRGRHLRSGGRRGCGVA